MTTYELLRLRNLLSIYQENERINCGDFMQIERLKAKISRKIKERAIK